VPNLYYVKKANCDKATKFASCIAGVSGDDNIALLWHDHFNNLCNSIDDDGSKDAFFARIRPVHDRSYCSSITVHDIISAISKQKKGKSSGPDGIPMEAFIYGNARLFVHLSFIFNLFIMHGYIPTPFIQSVIIPLAKVIRS